MATEKDETFLFRTLERGANLNAFQDPQMVPLSTNTLGIFIPVFYLLKYLKSHQHYGKKGATENNLNARDFCDLKSENWSIFQYQSFI